MSELDQGGALPKPTPPTKHAEDIAVKLAEARYGYDVRVRELGWAKARIAEAEKAVSESQATVGRLERELLDAINAVVRDSHSG